MVLNQQQKLAINMPVIKYRLRLFSTNESVEVRIVMWKYYEKLLMKRRDTLHTLREAY